MLIVGDTGVGSKQQRQVAHMIEHYHINHPLDAIIHTGDIFYPDGINSADDLIATTHFSDIYLNSAYNDVPWYLVAGNHDHDGNINALITFFNRYSSLSFPSLYYATQINKGNISVNIVAVDTDPIKKGTVQAEQLGWLQQTLAERQSDDAITIAVGHHPIFSNGEQGNTAALQGTFYALLQHYQVMFYLAGHEHNLEYIVKDELPQFIISGAAGAPLRDIECGTDSRFALSKAGGFALYVQPTLAWLIPLTETLPNIMFRIPINRPVSSSRVIKIHK